ncbi:hypothetical protein G9A89_016891 [Geosiphon pyriformis]|nr:hypothetical protein G9A89_016891 [Geosiphon pyriformis]
MEHPTITVVTAAHSVDYLGHTHSWEETDAIYTYNEVCKELHNFHKKCREDHEKPEYLQKVELYKELSKKRALKENKRGARSLSVSAGSDVPRKPVLQSKKSKDPLKKLQQGEWLQEKRLLRQKNALWRRMGVIKSGRLVDPLSLNWQKESDVLWLFGPLYQPAEPEHQDFDDDESNNCNSDSYDDFKTVVKDIHSINYSGSMTSYCIPTPNYTSPIKPVLKKHVETSPLEDLLAYYTCSVLLNNDNQKSGIDRSQFNYDSDSSYTSDSDSSTDVEDTDSGNSSDSSCSSSSSSARRHAMSRFKRFTEKHIMTPKKKKSLRFSPKLEQVHYTPTHYTRKLSASQSKKRAPPQRVNQEVKKNLGGAYDPETNAYKAIDDFAALAAGVGIDIKGVGMMDPCNDYDQIFNWAKSQIKTSDTFSMFCEDGKKAPTILSQNLKTATKFSIPKATLATNSTEKYEKMLAAAKAASFNTTPRRKVSTQYSKPIYDVELLSSDDEVEILGNNSETNLCFEAQPSSNQEAPSLVSKCVNIAENAKDVVSWFGAMLWDSSLV